MPDEHSPHDQTPGDLLSPVDAPEPAARAGQAPAGIALCLSGGGYRAMLFHAGALWRLNELGWLPKLDRVSSVSGGAITAGILGVEWHRLQFAASGVATNFVDAVVKLVRRTASLTVDIPAVVIGILTPGSIADKVIASYRKHLFGEATLQDLPDRPLFVINATNMQSGALWRFAKPYMRDYRVGEVRNPEVPLATAVAASSAFPPFLGPVRLALDPKSFSPPSGYEDLHREPYIREAVLCDGGVYDNMGLETAWKRCETVLVSDAGGKMSEDPDPSGEWVGQSKRVIALIDNQVRSLRKRQVIGSFRSGARRGAYWGIRSDIRDFGVDDALLAPHDATMRLAEIETRLAELDPTTQERLINWGYAICDAAMRRHVDETLPAPAAFPYPEAGVG